MATLYKISKKPTIYEETPQGYSPILGEQAFKEKGFSFGDVKEITPQEWATMRLSKGMTTPIGSEYVKIPYAPDVYKTAGGELQPIKSAAEYQTLTGGTDWSKVATISPELFSQYKLGLPIGEMEATGIATGQMAETIKSATQLPQIEAQQKGLGATILEKIKGLPALLTGKKKEVLEEKGVTSKEAQVSSYDKQIASLSTLYEKAINELRAKPISASIIQGREALYVRQEAIEIKGLTALREIVAGDVDRAYKLANEAVSEATQLEQAEINALIEERNQLASQATAESQKYTLMLNNAIKQREDRLAKEEKVNDQKVELMLKYPQAGISPTDTFDSALEKARKEGARQEVLTETKTPKVVSGEIVPTRDPEIEALAQAYLRGESLGSIGATKKANVLIRAKEITKERTLRSLKDPEYLTSEIDNAVTAGDTLRNINLELQSLGVPKETIQQAFRIRMERLEREAPKVVEPGFFEKTGSFLRKVFGIK